LQGFSLKNRSLRNAALRPIDHFCAGLERTSLSLKRGESPDKKSAAHIAETFISLTGTVLGGGTAGRERAEEIFYRALERCRNGSLEKIGALAAFFLGEYDDLMCLEDKDWEDIKETLEEASEEMNLDTLGALMGELVSRGKFG
jgi:hypothetical protein